jgi:hypothetical protein
MRMASGDILQLFLIASLKRTGPGAGYEILDKASIHPRWIRFHYTMSVQLPMSGQDTWVHSHGTVQRSC